MEVSFVGAILLAAVLVYDRLGGNHEVGRRLFQVGLAVSLVFLGMSATAAFIRSDGAPGSFTFSNSPSEQADRVLIASTAQYGLGILFLIAGLIALRHFHTVPLALILSGVFLLFTGPSLSTYSVSRYGVETSQSVDVAIFGIALAGTVALLAYGMQLERDFAVDSDVDVDEAGAASAEDSA